MTVVLIVYEDDLLVRNTVAVSATGYETAVIEGAAASE